MRYYCTTLHQTSKNQEVLLYARTIKYHTYQALLATAGHWLLHILCATLLKNQLSTEDCMEKVLRICVHFIFLLLLGSRVMRGWDRRRVDCFAKRPIMSNICYFDTFFLSLLNLSLSFLLLLILLWKPWHSLESMRSKIQTDTIKCQNAEVGEWQLLGFTKNSRESPWHYQYLSVPSQHISTMVRSSNYLAALWGV